MQPTAVITGVRGQDGSLLAEKLLGLGYTVYGVSRSDGTRPGNCAAVADKIRWCPLPAAGARAAWWQELIARVRPNELYHLAADSFVPNGWEYPEANLDANTGITLRILNAIRTQNPTTRLVNASSREVFGQVDGQQANEETPLRPTTPYGISKAASYWMVRAYRNQYGLFAVNAILFNHESPRRGDQFVSRKITKAVARTVLHREFKLELGSLAAQRDWGYAGDYVDAMFRMLRLQTPEDFVLGTGELHSVEDLVRIAYAAVGLDWRTHVSSHSELVRSNDQACVAADIRKAKQMLAWQPQIAFSELIERMVHADIERLQSNAENADSQ